MHALIKQLKDDGSLSSSQAKAEIAKINFTQTPKPVRGYPQHLFNSGAVIDVCAHKIFLNQMLQANNIGQKINALSKFFDEELAGIDLTK